MKIQSQECIFLTNHELNKVKSPQLSYSLRTRDTGKYGEEKKKNHNSTEQTLKSKNSLGNQFLDREMLTVTDESLETPCGQI